MNNQIIKTLSFNTQVRLYLINNTELINEIINLNENSSKITTLALANSISVVSLLSATLKGNQRLSAIITMSNYKNKIHTDADANGNIRGYANEPLLFDRTNYSTVKELIGVNGSIRIIKGVNMNQFTGITDMPNQDIDKDFTHFFKQSDQTETLIKTHIEWNEDDTVKNSYGIYAQLLPQASTDLLEIIDNKFKTLRPLLRNLNQATTEKINRKLTSQFGQSKIIGSSTAQFFCGCTKEMFYGLLHSIDKSELREYVQTDTSIKSTCNICGRAYLFSKDEIMPYLGGV